MVGDDSFHCVVFSDGSLFCNVVLCVINEPVHEISNNVAFWHV